MQNEEFLIENSSKIKGRPKVKNQQSVYTKVENYSGLCYPDITENNLKIKLLSNPFCSSGAIKISVEIIYFFLKKLVDNLSQDLSIAKDFDLNNDLSSNLQLIAKNK